MSGHKSSQMPNLEYQRLFAALPNAYIIVRADGPAFTIVDQNQAHADATMSDRQKNIGMPILQAFPDTSEQYRVTGRSELADSLQRVADTGKIDSLPLVKYDVQGTDGGFVEKWWRVTHHPLRDDTGKVEFVYQFTQDVTEEIIAGRQLAQAQSQLDSALAVGLVSTWHWDIQRDVVIGDKNLARQFGVSTRQAADGLPISIFIDSIHSDDRERISKAIATRAKDGRDYEEEYRTVTQKGQTRWVIARGKVENDSAGQPVNFSGILVDITDRKEAERRLEESKTIFDALFESRIVSIVLADMDGKILQANSKFLETFGYSQQDLRRGLQSEQLTPKTSIGKTVNIYDELRSTGQLQPTEKDYLRKDGAILPMLVGAVMLKNHDDRFVAFLLDISETKELKALNIAKDEFVALASHQLRTPATSVKQYLGIVMEEYAGPLTADQLQYLNIAYDANERQLTIINDLLKTARLDTQGYDLNLTECDINDIIESVIEQFKPVCNAKHQTILFEKHIRKLTALVDREEISLALINLVENASKYTEHGKTITITTTRSRQSISVSVQDEGVGIAKKDQAVIFEKFTRISNSLSDTVTGTGLGLYWVKRIVELHGGQLTVESALRRGTTFTMEVPS